MSEERLMKTPEEVRQKARELLQMPKEEVLTKYMFQEQKIERLNNIINELERTIYYKAKYFRDIKERSKVEICMDILNKLQELKGGDKE